MTSSGSSWRAGCPARYVAVGWPGGARRGSARSAAAVGRLGGRRLGAGGCGGRCRRGRRGGGTFPGGGRGGAVAAGGGGDLRDAAGPRLGSGDDQRELALGGGRVIRKPR